MMIELGLLTRSFARAGKSGFLFKYARSGDVPQHLHSEIYSKVDHRKLCIFLVQDKL
jgi:hypothetical protein